MSDNSTIPSGESNDQASGSDQNATSTQDMVSHATYLKVLDEKKKTAEKLREYEKVFKETQEAKLREENDLKKLLELREQELQEKNRKLEEVESLITFSVKKNAFLGALGAQIDEPYQGLVDQALEEVIIDPETRQPDKASLRKVVEGFKSKYGLIMKPKETRDLPGGSAKPPEKGLDSDWKALSLKEKRAQLADRVKAFQQRIS